MTKRLKKEGSGEGPGPQSRGRVILYAVAGFFCLAGLADATYLAVLALTGETAACSGQTGCFEVLGSAYARVAGIPTAAFGVAGYFTAVTCATFVAFKYSRAPEFFALTVGALFVTT